MQTVSILLYKLGGPEKGRKIIIKLMITGLTQSVDPIQQSIRSNKSIRQSIRSNNPIQQMLAKAKTGKKNSKNFLLGNTERFTFFFFTWLPSFFGRPRPRLPSPWLRASSCMPFFAVCIFFVRAISFFFFVVFFFQLWISWFCVCLYAFRSTYAMGKSTHYGQPKLCRQQSEMTQCCLCFVTKSGRE